MNKRRLKNIGFNLLAFLVLFLSTNSIEGQKNKIQTADSKSQAAGKIWTVEKANAWYNEHKWITGANFLPSTAINQLEMWQAATFDTATINRELGWAKNIGFNTMRVYLHSLAWKEDPSGFKNRMDKYLRAKFMTLLINGLLMVLYLFIEDNYTWYGRGGRVTRMAARIFILQK